MKNKKTFIFIGLILLILLITHYRWFFNFSILTAGDWGFYFKENEREFLRLPSFWDSRILGMFNFGISMYPAYLLWGVLSSIFSFALVERILYLWPSIIIAGFGSYFLIRKITKSNVAALLGSFVFVFNTYSIMLELSQLTLLVSFALAPVIILFFIKALEEKKLYLAVIAGIFSFISSFFEFRAFYIIFLVLFLYFLYHTFIIEKPKFKGILKNSLLSLALILVVFLLDFYWLFGTARMGTLVNNEIFGGGLFGNFMNISRVITLFHPFWTGGKIEVFVIQKIPLYFWLIPAFAFLGLLLNRKNKQILFFGFIAFLGILLAKQTAEPFQGLYQWLYSNIPGFSAFREASKFYFMIVLGYAVLIGSFMAWVWKNWREKKWQLYGKYLLLVSISLIFLWNAKPLINGQFGSMFVARQIPHDYLVLKDFIFSQPGFFRTFWTPNYSRWSSYSDQKPEISNAAILGSAWQAYASNRSYSDSWHDNERITEIFKIKGANELFNNSSIKYVVVPIKDSANDDDFFVSYGGLNNPNIRDWYISELDKVEWLKKIDIGTKELAIYENRNYKPHLYQTFEKETVNKNIPFKESDFKTISPTEYEIAIKNIKEPFYLNFSESFNANWKLRFGDFGWFKALTNKNYFLSDKYHFENNAKLNSFYLDPKLIKENFPGGYKENPDGSLDLNMTLYFKPQSHIYLGLIVSGIALAGCIGYFIYFWVSMRKKRKNEKNI